MQSGNTAEVKHALEKIVLLCREAKDAHVALLPLISTEEREKHDTWFAAKVLVEKWLVNDVEVDDVHPNDSISNVASRKSHRKSTCSGKSSNKSGKTTSHLGLKQKQKRLHCLLELQL